MINWAKIGRNVNAEGEVTITYQGAGTDLLIQSRKRNIPHANREGFWQHTSFFVMWRGEDLHGFATLEDAKVFAERVHNGQPV